MDNEPIIKTAPSMTFSQYARKSTTGENYPGTPSSVTIPSYTSRLEWLMDDTGKQRYNPCSHFVKKCSLDRAFSDASDTWVSTSNHALGRWIVQWAHAPQQWDGTRYGSSAYGMTGQFGAWDQPLAGLPLLYVSDVLGRRINTPDASHLKILIDRSLQAMLPGIKPELSLINSLIELKDMRTMVRSYGRINAAYDASNRLKEAYGLSKQVVKLITGKDRKALRNAALRTILRSSADSYLQAQFNISPLLRDIAGIQSAIARVREQVKNLVAREGRSQISHYKASLRDKYVPVTDSKTVNLPTAFVGGTATGRREVTYSIAMFYATMEYAYKLPHFYSPEDYLPAALGDAFGANWNPAIIWNALPWSFVIDWVAGVGRWLDQFKTRNIEPVTSISRYCYTTHVAREIKLSHGENGNVIPFARYEEEAYKRTPHNPFMQFSFTTSGLNPKEFSLAGALALSR